MNTEYIVPAKIIFAARKELSTEQLARFMHRGMVLRVACELELTLQDLLYSFLRSVNKSLDDKLVHAELFSENGLLNSLKNLCQIAWHLGLLTEDERHDIRITSELRNRYAHGPFRDTIDKDAKMEKLVHDFCLYKNSLSVFANEPVDLIFLACQQRLRQLLIQRAYKVYDSMIIRCGRKLRKD